MPGNAPDQETVEKAKRIRDEAEKRRSQAQENYQRVRADLQTEETALGENTDNEEEAKTRLSVAEEELKSRKDVLVRAQSDLRRLAEENRRRSGQLEGLAAQRENLQKRFLEEQEGFRE